MVRLATKSQTTKALESEFEASPRLQFQLALAETLHLTLYELKSKMTDEEMVLWQLHFNRKNKLQEKELAKIKTDSKRRR